MGQALYRKYRPRTLSDVAGQEHITTTLEKAIKTSQISHAYLLTGPKGVGKTSVARILAHAINGLSYSDDSTHIDIIEIDAASNGRIDEIRELRERVYVAPTLAKYKIYIIDEVHMLTKEAFNALLKTLEEPPEHVIFILATTDAHKLPDTIISRTQRYSFKPIGIKEIADRLSEIAKKEKIKVNRDALELIAKHGQGSLRDAIGLLDQSRSYGSEVSLSSVMMLLGLASEEAIINLIELSLHGTSSAELITALNKLYEQGYQPEIIAKEIAEILRNEIINPKLNLDRAKILDILSDLIEVPASREPTVYLELILLRSLVKETIVIEESPKDEIKISPKNETKEPEKKIEEDKNIKASPKKKTTTKLDKTLWPEVLKSLKKSHNTLYGIIRMGEPTFNDDRLILNFAYDFHRKRINEAANKKILSDIILELTGDDIIIDCQLDKSAKPFSTEPTSPVNDSDDISTISSIFQGAELLES